jgi:murein DD-endopeptidase MepM/ murein hydrolase activator NlpD
MTSTERTFPKAFRVLAAACAIFALAVVVPAAAQTTPPTEEDVDEAKAAYEAKVAELQDVRAQLTEVQMRLNEAVFEVDRQEGLLEQVEAELLVVHKRIDHARRRYQRIRQRLNDRAAEAFISGPGTNLEFFLGATSLADLSDRIEYVEAVAESDAALAQEVENLRNQLAADEAELERLEEQREAQLAEAQKQQEAVEADLALVQQLYAEIETLTAEALSFFEDQKKEYKKHQRELAAMQQGGGHAYVPMPAEWEGTLEVCPVDQPRGFGDGFGAPRYVGGYHPHRGVDIVAPEGTYVRATFAGTAVDATNSLGGIAVQVYGAYGYTYNAHLLSIEKLGHVEAGDIIGRVSSTGLAGGSTPHNHFEFHPGVMPSSWPESYYGYSVIGDAINPYPLLVDACG